jgi:hypothetical protein
LPQKCAPEKVGSKQWAVDSESGDAVFAHIQPIAYQNQAAISSDTDICENEWNQPSALELI